MKQTPANTYTPSNTRKARKTISGVIISFAQIAAARLCRLYLRYGSFDIKNDIVFDPHRRYLFVANHQSQLDPFAVFGVLELTDNLTVAPVRFLTAKTVYFTPMLPLLKLFGCYPTRGARAQIIEESVDYLRRGYNVFIFPEGKRTLQATSEPRRGVSDLISSASAEFEDIAMILVHIEWKRGRFGRRHVSISLTEAPAQLHNKDAVTIMNTLYKV